MISKKQHRRNHLLVFALIAMSGFPFFYMDPLLKPLLFVTFVWAFILFINRRDLRTDTFLGIYILIFVIISIGQVLTFDVFPMTTIVGYLIRILLAYLVIKIVGRDFIRIYIRQLFVFCVISFVFYFSSLLINNVETFFVHNVAPIFELPRDPGAFYAPTPNILLFNFNSGLGQPGLVILRNSGPFWEPGAFAGFALIALIFNLIRSKKLANRYNMVFILAILTTTSTSGYIALFLLIFLYYLQLSKNLVKILITPLVIGIAFFSYYQFEFLGAKIDKNTHNFGKANTSNRFVSAARDFEDISDYWLFGRGMNEATRYDFSVYQGEQEKHRNNGVTAILVNIGILTGLLYFQNIYRSFASMCRYYGLTQFFAFSIILVILVIGFSEGYFTKVLFIALTMLHLNYSVKPSIAKA